MIESPVQTLSWLPWSWCNLRRNPFGELSRRERAELAVVDIDAIIERVSHSCHAVQLIGACGRGKTTRMLALLSRLPEASYVYLAEDEPCAAIPCGKPLLIDEAQRLPRHILTRMVSTRLPMVLATHRNLSRPLRKAGYEVHTLQIGSTNDTATICKIVNRRIEASRLSDGPVPKLRYQQAKKLSELFGSNIRSMESYLYEIVQQQGYGNGELRFID